MNQLTEAYPQVWGGIECTINRIGDDYIDQLLYSGHYDRWKKDIEKFASLGIRAMRYPVLWERHEPDENSHIDWSSTAVCLHHLRQRKIEPIVGLVHHGSGPAFTDLLDPLFPEKLAAYAAKVAAQFPWVQYYTPVNEPLTTARFSGLYGLWYPHHKSDISFAKMLLNQMKATVLCMQEIRKVNPDAKLIQTEDLNKTYSRPVLSYQADFENERRWMTFGLLCGKLKPGTKMHDYLGRLGITTAELQFFEQHPCPPSIMGLNYYLTSERWLDERLHLYPEHTHGGNGLHQYADLEAVRIQHEEKWGLKVLMEEAWQRYRLPLALTECHLHCSREEQVRWLAACWQDVNALRQAGVDVRAFTAWSLLGSFGWDNLLTGTEMNYESGVFDVRSGEARETALAKIIRQMAAGQKVSHQLCNVPGWWVKDRMLSGNLQQPLELHQGREAEPQPLLIIGKNGTLARAFAHICRLRHIPFICAGRHETDISNFAALEKLFLSHRPWAIVNTAGYVDIDQAELDEIACMKLNTVAPVLMASLCSKHSIPFMTFSSDQVFDGKSTHGYIESDRPNPLNLYGQTKMQQEELVLNIHPDACVVRTSAFFGPWDEHNFVSKLIDSLRQGQPVQAAGDVFISPTYVPDLVNACLNMLIDGEKGIFHLQNQGTLSWAAFGKEVAKMAGLNAGLVKSVPAVKMGWAAPRPAYSGLESEKGLRMPSLRDGLKRFFMERSAWLAARAGEVPADVLSAS